MKLQIVPASTGATWVKLGIATFFKQPLALGGLFFMSLAASQVLAIVPFIGMVMALIIMPATTLGMMLATIQATQGKFPMPSMLISAFRAGPQRSKAMLKLGCMYAAGFMAVYAIVAMIDGGEIAKEIAKTESITPEIFQLPNFLFTVSVGMGLYMVLSLLFWHAPALVHLHNVPPSKALFFSLVACLRNWAAYLVYGLTWLGVFALAVMILSTVAALLGLSAAAGGFIVLPLVLVLTTIFICSIYFTFRDSFLHMESTDTDAQPKV
jgi:hypothetical protein